LSNERDENGVVILERYSCSLVIAHEAASTTSAYNVSLRVDFGDYRVIFDNSSLTSSLGVVQESTAGFMIDAAELSLNSGFISINFTVDVRAIDLELPPPLFSANLSYKGQRFGLGRSYSTSLSPAIARLPLSDEGLLLSYRVASSIGITSDPNVTIGELVEFVIAVSPNVSTTPHAFLVQVALPLGELSINAGVDIAIGSGIVGDQLTAVAPTEVSQNSTHRIVELDFGLVSVQPSATGYREVEQVIVIRFAALVGDTSSSTFANLDQATMSLAFGDTVSLATYWESVTLVEPELVASPVAHAINASALKPGELVDFAVTFAHLPVSSLEAFNVLFRVAVPTGVTILNSNATVVNLIKNISSVELALSSFNRSESAIVIAFTVKIEAGVFSPLDSVVATIEAAYYDYSPSEVTTRVHSLRSSFQLGTIATIQFPEPPADAPAPPVPTAFDQLDPTNIPVDIGLDLPPGTKLDGQIFEIDLGELVYNPSQQVVIIFSGSYISGNFTVRVENGGSLVVITIISVVTDPLSSLPGSIAISVPTKLPAESTVPSPSSSPTPIVPSPSPLPPPSPGSQPPPPPPGSEPTSPSSTPGPGQNPDSTPTSSPSSSPSSSSPSATVTSPTSTPSPSAVNTTKTFSLPTLTLPLLNYTKTILVPFTAIRTSTLEDLPANITLSWYPSILNATIVNPSSLGSDVSLNVVGNTLFIESLPPLDVSGVDNFTVLVFVDSKTYQAVQVVVDIDAVADAPVANDDNATVYDAAYHGIPLWPLANDVDPENDIDPSSLQVFYDNSTAGVSLFIANLSTSAPVVVLVSNETSGHFEAEYEICDYSHLCSRATMAWDWNSVSDFNPISTADSLHPAPLIGFLAALFALLRT